MVILLGSNGKGKKEALAGGGDGGVTSRCASVTGLCASWVLSIASTLVEDLTFFRPFAEMSENYDAVSL